MWKRRRTALNEALHELRRPLQALVLAGAGTASGPEGIEATVRLATSALERLDREINGGRGGAGPAEPVQLAGLAAAAVSRWRGRAALAGATLALRGREETSGAPPELVLGDRLALGQAIDNLVLNAIEHGGPRVVVSVAGAGGRLRVVVRDCGRPLAGPDARTTSLGSLGLGGRFRGGGRHGHGLRVVRRVASAHGGRFELVRGSGGAEAVLELPVR